MWGVNTVLGGFDSHTFPPSKQQNAMILSTIEKIMRLLQDAFSRLDARVSLRTIEELSVTVHKTMTAKARSYHTLEHVFHLAEHSDPHHRLAALFHDLVYYQIDLGFPREVRRIVAPYFSEGRGLSIIEQIAPEERLAWLTLDLFGYAPGQRLSPFTGLNEFSSALFMNYALREILTERDLLRLTACVEATIPFRPKNARGESCVDVLGQRLRHVNSLYQCGLTPDDIEGILNAAVIFANHDVDGFAEPDPGTFLDGSWKVLLESNTPLHSTDVYSIRDYRQGLQHMGKFLCHLNPDTIFHQYHGEPSDDAFAELIAFARRNLVIGCEYVNVKLLAIAIFEALAELTGGDAPLSLFMGDLKREGVPVKRLEQFLPDGGYISPNTDDVAAVMDLLEMGRAAESSFDLKNSPTSFFVYTHIHEPRRTELVRLMQEMFAGTLPPDEFLNAVDPFVVSVIARACAEMVFSRREALLRYQECQSEALAVKAQR